MAKNNVTHLRWVLLFQSKKKASGTFQCTCRIISHPHFKYEKKYQNKYYPYVHWFNYHLTGLSTHSLSLSLHYTYTLQVHKDGVYQMVLALTWAIHLTHKIPSQPPTPFPRRSSTL